MARPIPEHKRRAGRLYDVAPEWPEILTGPTRLIGQSHTDPFAFQSLTRVRDVLYRAGGDTYEQARWELERLVEQDLAA